MKRLPKNLKNTFIRSSRCEKITISKFVSLFYKSLEGILELTGRVDIVRIMTTYLKSIPQSIIMINNHEAGIEKS